MKREKQFCSARELLRATAASKIGGQVNHETRATETVLAVITVFRADGAVMRLNDLLGDREAEPRMRPEILAFRPLAIEAIEDRPELAFGDPGAGILDGNADHVAGAPRPDGDCAAWRAEGDGVVE